MLSIPACCMHKHACFVHVHAWTFMTDWRHLQLTLTAKLQCERAFGNGVNVFCIYYRDNRHWVIFPVTSRNVDAMYRYNFYIDLDSRAALLAGLSSVVDLSCSCGGWYQNKRHRVIFPLTSSARVCHVQIQVLHWPWQQNCSLVGA